MNSLTRASWIDFLEAVDSVGLKVPKRYRLGVAEAAGAELFDSIETYWFERIKECISSGGVAQSDFRTDVTGYKSAYLDELFKRSAGDRIENPMVVLLDRVSNDDGVRGVFIDNWEEQLRVEIFQFHKYTAVAFSSGYGLQEIMSLETEWLPAKVPTQVKAKAVNIKLPKPTAGYLLKSQKEVGVFTWFVKSRFSDAGCWYVAIYSDELAIILPGWDFFVPGYNCYGRHTSEASLHLCHANVKLSELFITKGFAAEMLAAAN